MERFTFEVKPHIAVTVFDNESGNEMPFLFQPFSPESNKFWVSPEEAQTWATGYIAQIIEREAVIAAEQSTVI